MVKEGNTMEWLTRADIDRVIAELSAEDLIEATADAKGARIASVAFNAAAVRVLGELPEGKRWAQRVRVSDTRYLADKIGEAVNIDSPLSGETSDMLASLDSGESETLLTSDG